MSGVQVDRLTAVAVEQLDWVAALAQPEPM
jgi:hypothetical protein